MKVAPFSADVPIVRSRRRTQFGWDEQVLLFEKGETVEEFLDNFPTVAREQAVAFLEEAGRAFLTQIA